ncbi:aminopeptidase N-like [Ptychodera flava]|uniref:aminopeptidase N-like n=1 Tax=Ptychodera flava TaxID=63121 RepID=UPI003969D762
MAKGEMEDGDVTYHQKAKSHPRGIFFKYLTLVIAVTAILVVFVIIILLVYFLHPGWSATCLEKLPPLQVQQKPRPFRGRLPDHLKPINYRIMITPYLDEEDGDKRFFFDGNVRILVNCTITTDTIVLHAFKIDIDVDSVSVDEMNESDNIGVKDITTDQDYQFFIIKTEKSLQRGHQYNISMDYVGILNHSDTVGLYVGTYQSGEEIRYIISTQLELTHARRVFPSFDEPSFKATFDVILKHRRKRWALSNMPSIVNITNGDWNTVYFGTSPVMSTYLVAIVLSDFVCKETNSRSGVRLRVWAKEAVINETEFALEVGVHTLDYFEDLLAIKFQLPKLDMVAVPVFTFGAMENWGLVIYAQRAMLVNQDTHPISRDLPNARIVCHELAHMWFGNIVTMQWWSESWLNEGFATYFEYPGLDNYFPEWDVNRQFRIGMMIHRAFDVDGERDSHPTIQPGVGWSHDLIEQFDSRVYERGGSILLMIRSFLGDHVMYHALRNYLRKHSYDVATTDDLWYEMTRSAQKFGISVDVKKMMDPWLLQFGYPVVNIRRTGVSIAIVEQRHYLSEMNDKISNFDTGYTWYIPLTYVHSSSNRWPPGNSSLIWIDKTTESTTLELDGAREDDWILANIYQHGFYVINYDMNNWQKLIQQLQRNHTTFPVENRAAVIHDSFSLARSGDIDVVVAFQVIDYLRYEEDFSPWKVAIGKLGYVSNMLKSTPSYGYLESFVRGIIMPVYAKFGWKFGRDDLKQYHLQLEAVKLSCQNGNEDCARKSKQEYSLWMASNGQDRIEFDARRTVFCSAIRQGGFKEWQFAFNYLLDTKDTFMKNDLLRSLGCISEPWLLQKYLVDVLELYNNGTGKDEVIPDFMREWEYAVDKYNIFTVINLAQRQSAMAFQHSWKFAMQHFDDLRLKDENQAFHMIWEFSKNMNNEEDLIKLEDFAAKYNGMPGHQVTQYYKALQRVKGNILWMKRNHKSLASWLEKRFRA